MSDDPVTRMLQRLSDIAPDETRAERVRARCRAALAAQAASLRERRRAAEKTPSLDAAMPIAFGAQSLRRSE